MLDDTVIIAVYYVCVAALALSTLPSTNDSSDIAACSSEYVWLSMTNCSSFLCSPGADGPTFIMADEA